MEDETEAVAVLESSQDAEATGETHEALAHVSNNQNTPQHENDMPASPNQTTEVEPTVYTHKHADGEVVSGTIEQAVRQCPALGKLSVKEAGMILELKAIGEKKRAEREKQKAEDKKAEATKQKEKEQAVKDSEPEPAKDNPSVKTEKERLQPERKKPLAINVNPSAKASERRRSTEAEKPEPEVLKTVLTSKRPEPPAEQQRNEKPVEKLLHQLSPADSATVKDEAEASPSRLPDEQTTAAERYVRADLEFIQIQQAQEAALAEAQHNAIALDTEPYPLANNPDANIDSAEHKPAETTENTEPPTEAVSTEVETSTEATASKPDGFNSTDSLTKTIKAEELMFQDPIIDEGLADSVLVEVKATDKAALADEVFTDFEVPPEDNEVAATVVWEAAQEPKPVNEATVYGQRESTASAEQGTKFSTVIEKISERLSRAEPAQAIAIQNTVGEIIEAVIEQQITKEASLDAGDELNNDVAVESGTEADFDTQPVKTLESQLVKLFEQADLDYHDEQIEGFASVLITKDKEELQALAEGVELSYVFSEVGTHEGLRQDASILKHLKKITRPVPFVLARFVLLFALSATKASATQT